MHFTDLGLSENILKAVAECGYDTPTPIQAQAIPIILMGRDIVGLAQTGTGKTAGFTLPMIEIMQGGRAKARMPRSLILSPTRELAAQIAENFDTYGKYAKLTKALLVGGTSMDEQIKKLDRGVDVLIATPGRLLDLFERGKILLSDIKILVIDEADRMLDMGFIPDIEKIVSRLSPIRQTLLFSATMPPEIKKLTQKFLSNPKEVSVAPTSSTSERVTQFLVSVHPKDKLDALDKLMRKEEVKNAFIFCNRKRDMGGVVQYLQRKGYAAKGINGDMEQSARTKTLAEFKEGKVTMLVCSDVAARGLDVDDVSHVFNYDVPFNAEDYVHRIGRTGRAGKEGRAWMLATKDEQKYVDAIEKLIKQKITVENAGRGSERAPREERLREEKPRSERQDSKQEARAPREERQPERQQKKPVPRENHQPERNVQGFGDEMPGFFGGQGKR
ncbi:MAG: DEAD/DEAH box helicase [Alphaproteobacteria bacterium]|jgi:superfamily II DNA/RNA helicase|nr:DEAD/DEAH box helicase [Alphaproteobacteria bacterium]